MNKTQLDKTLGTIKKYVDTTKMNYLKYTSNVDVNTLKTTGIYSLPSNCTNNGTTNAGTLIVDFNVGTPYQLWIPDNTHSLYKRNWDKTNSVWKTWTNTYTGNVTGSSSSCTGNAATATKLATARTISLTGDTTGSVSFDGSANVSFETKTRQVAFVGSDTDGTAGWYKVAEQTCSGYGDTNITFMVTSTYANYNFGILQLQIRSDDSSIACKNLGWIARKGLDKSHYIVVISGMKWTLYAYQPNPRYGRLAFEILSQSSINGKSMTWTLNFANNSTKESKTPTATVTSSDVATVNSANSLTTARTLTIGSKGKTFDGSANVSWTLDEIGAAPKSHGTHVSYGGNGSATTVSRSDHTHNYAGSGSAGGSANSAVKLATARNIALTGDVTGNANFDGSGNISITTAVGDDTHEHNHLKSRGKVTAESGTTYPAQKGLSMGEGYNNGYSVPYGNVLTMYGSGVSQLYIGWSGISGAHEKAYIRSKRDTNDANYSGWAQIYTSAHPQPSVTGSSGSCTGNAATATKLATARTINGTSFDGSANITTANWGTSRKLNRTTVNGSADVSIPLDYITCGVGDNNTNNYHLILESGKCTSDYTDKSIVIMVCNHYNNNSFGIAKATLRTNNASGGDKAAGELIWIVRCGFAANVLCYNIRNTAKDTYMDVFYKSTGTYNSATIYILGEGARGNQSSQWTKNNTSASGTKAYTETAMKALRSYTSTLVSATDAGVVNKANQLVTARKIKLTGDVTGEASFNGTADASITATVANDSHTHSNYLPLAGGTLTGATTFNNYLKLNAWSGYGSGTANLWYDGTNKTVEIETATNLKLAGTKVSKEGHTHKYAGSSSAGGAANSAKRLDNAGTNTITSTSNDTTSKWGAYGMSVHWYNTAGQLNNQPSQYGYLLNVGTGSEVHQLWMTQASGNLAHRGGNASGWSGSWRTIVDSENINSYRPLFIKTSVGDGGWTVADNNACVTVSGLAYWNGAYTGSNSNLAYCKHGAIGDMAVRNSSDVGRVKSSNWWYSTGKTGWYNETYDGGWYMEDATWLRSYANKSIYTAGTIRADGEFSCIRNSGDTYLVTQRTDTGVICKFGIGNGGSNHGVYSKKFEKWIVYGDADNNVVKYAMQNGGTAAADKISHVAFRYGSGLGGANGYITFSW